MLILVLIQRLIYGKKESTKQREIQERKQKVVEKIAPKAQTPFALNC